MLTNQIRKMSTGLSLLVGLTMASSALASEPGRTGDRAELTLAGFVCVTRNLRGAEYFGRSYGYGPYARDQACNDALVQCYRDSILPRTCHVINSWPE